MRRILLVFIVLLMIGLSGCMEHIEDQNGDDTSLFSFTIQEKLDSGTFSSRGTYSSASYSGLTTYASMYEDIDYDNIVMSYDLFSGVSKIQATEMDAGDSFSISVEYEILSGNFEVVLVNPDDEIICEFNDNTTSFTVDNAVEGIYFIIIGGESTEFNITIDRTIG